MKLIPASGSPHSVDLARCLELPEFADARVLVATAGLRAPVTWVSVIEWPVEHFVSPGDLVLTTGVGCDEAKLCEMVRECGQSGAVAVCVGTGPGAIHETVGPAVAAAAEQAGLVLIALPWRLRFSDLSRAIIAALYGGSPPSDAMEGLPVPFTHALLGPSGVAGVAEALEQVVGAPVVIFDAILATVARGERGAAWLADDGVESDLIASLARLTHDAQRAPLDGVVELDLSSMPGSEVMAVPAVVHDGMLGWVVVSVPNAADRDMTERALLHAGTATAIEMLRKVADEEAETRAREAFFWEVARRAVESKQELAARAALLGLSLSSEFIVALGLVDAPEARAGASSSIRAFVNQVRRRLTHPSSVVALRGQEILLCRHPQDDLELGMLAEVNHGVGGLTVTWGIATGRHDLTTLVGAVTQARTALAVTRVLWGPGAVGREDQLGSYMLLHRIAGDGGALAVVDKTLGPLEDADGAKRSQLVGTLAAYLDANGNISSAARSLYLNRHSLIYRLRRISELTGLDLDSHEDRLLLDMSLKIRRLQAIEDGDD